MSAESGTIRPRLIKSYMWVITCTGGLLFVTSALRLSSVQLDLTLAALVALTLFLSSRIIIPIPRFSSQISVSDTFIFLTLLLYGREAATLLAATEALISSLRFSKKASTIAFNTGCSACSTFLTASCLYYFFDNIETLHKGPLSPTYIACLSLMALVQYAGNSGLVAICGALKAGQRIWATWHKHYLWTSITYFAGALAAGLIARLIGQVGFFAVIVTTPIIAIVFFTYRTYLKNVESSIAQAEQAERHVQELSHYIAEQERIREQFSQMEKLSALGELASGVAHDFNNTLAGILGRAQLLLRTNDSEKLRHGLNIIIKAAEDGAKTVRRIQDFARQRRDHDFGPVSVAQLLLEVSEITRPRWKDRAEASNIHISLDLQIRSNSMVMGDDSELREVLVNIVFNAVDAMPQGGNLMLSAEDEGDSVVISIADSGSGMTQEVRSRIFDPFFTTKGKAGLGLGLAVSFGIIRRHEGSIQVESEVGRGTTFRISLPVATVSVGSPAEISPRDEPSVASSSRTTIDNQAKILVVDDEEYIRDLLRDMLESEGCQVYLAEGGREALALFEGLQLDAVFTDVGMPGMSGWELAHAIRQRSETIPIAVITGWGEAVGSDAQKEASVDWVITKPFTTERIGELARELNRQRSAAVKRAAFSVIAA
jgi:signal transduction histidine kinase/ActR/RegA family two-component response regulator